MILVGYEYMILVLHYLEKAVPQGQINRNSNIITLSTKFSLSIIHEEVWYPVLHNFWSVSAIEKVQNKNKL